MTSVPKRMTQRSAYWLLSGGFTQLELAIVLVVIGILMAVGVPSGFRWVANAQIRSHAEQLHVAIALTRSEALRRNRQIEFLLTDSDAAAGSVGAATPSWSGRNWMVRVFRSTPSDEVADFIQGGNLGNNSITVQSDLSNADPANRLIYSGLGTTNLMGSIQIHVRHRDPSRCSYAGGDLTCLVIEVSPGGATRSCDPQVTDGSDPRACSA
jgi:type IV fimbrial biogenesis protein FimT